MTHTFLIYKLLSFGFSYPFLNILINFKYQMIVRRNALDDGE